MVATKSPINPKEKARLKAMHDHIAQYSFDPEAMKRVALSYSQLEQAYLRRCQSALGKGEVAVSMGTRMLIYVPAKGDLVWLVHPSIEKQGHDATITRKDGVRIIYGEDGKGVPAARVAYAAVHGSIPENHEVYCVNNDPSDLTVRNLRSREVKESYVKALDRMVQDPVEVPGDLRAKLRALREAREAREQD